MGKLQDMGLTPELFYRIGMWCFSIIALMAFISLIGGWGTTTATQKISSVFQIGFQVALVFFFRYLYNQVKPSVDMPTQKELEDLMEKLK